VQSNVRRFLEATETPPLLIACIAHGEDPVFKGLGEPSNKLAFEVLCPERKRISSFFHFVLQFLLRSGPHDHKDIGKWSPRPYGCQAVLAVRTEFTAVDGPDVLSIRAGDRIVVGEPRPAAWFSYESIATPVTAGSMVDMLDVAHISFGG
jgi:hypothetical protein